MDVFIVTILALAVVMGVFTQLLELIKDKALLPNSPSEEESEGEAKITFDLDGDELDKAIHEAYLKRLEEENVES